MKALSGWLIGLVFGVSASAEPLLEGRVRLDSGEPVTDAQVRLFDLSDLRQGAIARAMTDGTGYFALPLSALEGRALPARFALGPNYPNPFNPSTIIPYQLAASSQVRLEVFNLLGQHIATLVDGERPAGFHTATWHATDGVGRAVGAGVYIYRMTVGVESQTGRMVLLDGQADVAASGAASVMPGASGVRGLNGEGAQVYGLVVSGSGLVPYVDPAFRVESGMAPVELVMSSGHHSAGKATDDDCPLCDFFDAFNDAAKEKEKGPDLIVQSPSVSDSMLTPGQAFTLDITVHNQGDEQAAATMLHYYRSNNSTITASDTEVGTDAIDALDASATSEESIALTAPTGGGSGVYYGACVASVSDESDTYNNCSSGAHVLVEEEDGADGQDEDLVFTDPQIYNDNVFVLPVAENLAAGNLPYQDYAARFYETFDDAFDFLMIVSNLPEEERAVSYIGAYFGVKNDVQGIGLSIFSDNSNWGSAGKLQGVIDFPIYSTYYKLGRSVLFEGPTLHELMHRWANFIVRASGSNHWGFTSVNGMLGGFDIANLVDHGGGRYTAGGYGVWGGWGNTRPYSPLELYLAGFIPPEEVPDFLVAEDGQFLHGADGLRIEVSNGNGEPMPMFTASRFSTYTIEDIIAEHGRRVPDHSQAQKDFRAAVILLIDKNHLPTRDILETLSDDISWFSHVGNVGIRWDDRYQAYNFYEATGGRATITMDDLSHFQRRASAKRLAPNSFGTPPPPIVDHWE